MTDRYDCSPDAGDEGDCPGGEDCPGHADAPAHWVRSTPTTDSGEPPY